MSSGTPALSIVIASLRPGPVLFDCLAAIEPQVQSGIEVLLVDGSGDDTNQQVQARFPWVRMVESGKAQSLPALRGLGMAVATAPVVGILDAWCLVGPQWVAEVVRLHREHPELVIGGGVELEASERHSFRAWATYLYDYWEFVAPFRDGVVGVLPGNNITYKRPALPSAETLRARGFWKAFTNAGLTNSGQLLASSALAVRIRRRIPLAGFLRSRFHHGRSYAAMRVESASWARRCQLVLITPGLPLLFLARQTRGLVSKRDARGWFLLCLPVLLAFHVSWAWGELCGYLGGAGRSHGAIRS